MTLGTPNGLWVGGDEMAMKDSSKTFNMAHLAKPCGLRTLATAGLLAAALSPAAIALAQNAQPLPAGAGAAQPPPAQPAQPAPQAAAPAAPEATRGRGLFPLQPPPAERPGFIYAFGRWWDSTRGRFENLTKPPDDTAKGSATATQDAVHSTAPATGGAASAAQDAMRSAAEATKDAATALFRLPATRVVEVRQRCALAPNGAPDCGTAATMACRAKGFGEGHPVDVQSSENCPPAVWMSGREPAAGECPEETVVLMAACQ